MNVPSNLVAEWVVMMMMMMIRGGRLREVPAVEWFDLRNFGVSGRRLLMGGGRLREMVAHGGSTVLVYKVSVSRAFFATGCKLNRLISLMSSSFDGWAFRSSGVVISGRQQHLHEDLFIAWLSKFQTFNLRSDFRRAEHFCIQDIYFFRFTVFYHWQIACGDDETNCIA